LPAEREKRISNQRQDGLGGKQDRVKLSRVVKQ